MIYLQHTVYEAGERVGEIYGDNMQEECRLLALMQPQVLKLRNYRRFYGYGDWNYNFTWIPFDEAKLQQLKQLVDLWERRQPYIRRFQPPVSVHGCDSCSCDHDGWTPSIQVIPYTNDSTTCSHEGVQKTMEIHADGMLVQELYTLQDDTTCILEHDIMTLPNSSPLGLQIEQQDLATLDEFVELWRMRWKEHDHA